nr:MAG TPA: immunity protein [Caudoviricetes sp.]
MRIKKSPTQDYVSWVGYMPSRLSERIRDDPR